MANQINENSGPGKSTWTPMADGSVQSAYSSGYMAKIFAKFFATEAQRKIAAAGDPRSIEGDLIVNPGGLPDITSPLWSYTRGLPFLPEAELNRKRRYDEYEKMDDYPEITAALDIYADDSTQKDLRNNRWKVVSDSIEVTKEVEKLFKRINLHRHYYDIVRNACKFGDSFVEVVANARDMKSGIRKIKCLNPYYIMRIEDQFGYLKTFLQEVPKSNSHSGDWMMSKSDFIELDPNQIVHFRLDTSDPKYYPYGKSILAGAIRTYRSLKLMEDAMLVYRLARAPERRIFYIDVGNLPSAKAEAFLENVKTRFKKEKFQNGNKIDGRYNPLAVDEDFFIPIRGNQGTKVDTLKGAENLGEVDDVKYFRDKLLAILKIPKDYIVEYDKSPERKANLSQLDVKFARVVKRVQDCIAEGLADIAKKHLRMTGNYAKTLINNVRIELPEASDVFIKRKLEIDEAKARVVAAVLGTGLFSKKHIYKEFYDMHQTEIEILEKELKKDQEEQMSLDAKEAGMQAQAQNIGQSETQMATSQNQAAMDMAVSDNQAKNDIAVNKSQQQGKEKPKPKKEDTEYLVKLKQKYLLEEGESSERYKALSRAIKNSEIN